MLSSVYYRWFVSVEHNGFSLQQTFLLIKLVGINSCFYSSNSVFGFQNCVLQFAITVLILKLSWCVIVCNIELFRPDYHCSHTLIIVIVGDTEVNLIAKDAWKKMVETNDELCYLCWCVSITLIKVSHWFAMVVVVYTIKYINNSALDLYLELISMNQQILSYRHFPLLLLVVSISINFKTRQIQYRCPTLLWV